MRTQSISDSEFQKRYDWKPPKIVDRSVQSPGQQTLPGLGDLDKGLPAKGITDKHPLYHERNNPKVWGSLVGHHNPFLDSDLPDSYDAPEGWQNAHDSGWNADNNKLADKVTKHLQKNVSAGHPCVNVTDHTLHKVLNEGRVKSQFETQTSRGSLNIPARSTCEEANFGYRHPQSSHNEDYDKDDYQDEYDENERRGEEKHPDHARPVYGYLAHDPLKNETARMYGEHTLVLKKPKVWHRTTTTMSDSLGSQHEMRASPVQKVSLDSAAPSGADSDYHHPAFDKPENDEYENDLHNRLRHHLKHSLDDTGDYTEAQYHGGVSTNDIHYAVLRGAGGDDGHRAIKDHLDKVKVPWVHIGSGNWSGPGAGTIVKSHSHHEALLHRAVHYQVTLVAALEGSSMAPKIVAERVGGIYLLDLGNGKGQIAETKSGMLFPPKPLEALIARGYWEPTDSVDAADVLPLVKPV